jgi:hypothetical protein
MRLSQIQEREEISGKRRNLCIHPLMMFPYFLYNKSNKCIWSVSRFSSRPHHTLSILFDTIFCYCFLDFFFWFLPKSLADGGVRCLLLLPPLHHIHDVALGLVREFVFVFERNHRNFVTLPFVPRVNRVVTSLITPPR